MSDHSAGKWSNVSQFPDRGLVPPREPPHDGGMEARLRELEKSNGEIRERLVKIETKLDHVATAAALESVRSDLIKWFVGTAVALGAIAFTAAKFIH